MANTSITSISSLRTGARNFTANISINGFGTTGIAVNGMASPSGGSYNGSTLGYPTFAAGSGTICDMSTSTALKLPIIGDSTSDLYLYGSMCNNNANYLIRLEDLLWGRGSLSLTTAATTTITGSTVTRFSTVGGQLYLYCTSAPSGTLTVNPVATVSYTNQDGTSGRTARFYDLVAANSERIYASLNVAGRRLKATLQAGDTGVRSVESFTVVTASTGWTGGAWAVVIAKPLATVKSWQFNNNRVGVNDFLHTGIVKVHSGSSSANTTPCITCVTQPSGALTASTNALVLNFLLVRE